MTKKKSENAEKKPKNPDFLEVNITVERDEKYELPKDIHFVFPAGFKTGTDRSKADIKGGIYISKDNLPLPKKIILNLE